MKTKLKIFSVLIFSLFILSACTGRPIDLGFANTKTNLTEIDFNKGRNLSATASGFQLLLFIPIQINSRQSW